MSRPSAFRLRSQSRLWLGFAGSQAKGLRSCWLSRISPSRLASPIVFTSYGQEGLSSKNQPASSRIADEKSGGNCFNTCAQITMARDSSNAEIAAAISAVGRQTLNDRVYRELKKSIMSGAFKPGSELKLRSVAEALGTSLMPVRDAMRRLMAERALEMRPSRTIAIPVLSADQFLEIRAIRLLLEGEAVTRAANIAKYVPDGDIRDSNYVNSYDNGMVLEHVLKAAGKDLSRENILRQALSIKDLGLPMLLPGIKVNTGKSNHLPVEQLQFMRFTGKQWERFGEVLSTK